MLAYEYLNQLSLEDLALLEVDISCEFEYTTPLSNCCN